MVARKAVPTEQAVFCQAALRPTPDGAADIYAQSLRLATADQAR